MAAMPGASCFWMIGAKRAETSFGGRGLSWMLIGVVKSKAGAMASTGFIRVAPLNLIELPEAPSACSSK